MSFEASILRKWFSRFKEGHFDMNDSDFDKDRQNALVRVDPRQLTREFASMMASRPQYICIPWVKLKKLRVWVHVWSEYNKNYLIHIMPLCWLITGLSTTSTIPVANYYWRRKR